MVERSEQQTAPNWRDRPCLGTPIALWYGPADDEPRETPAQRVWRERRAAQLCATCPFIEVCLADELRRGVANQWGVRGGLTAQQRQTLIRRRRTADRGAA